MNDNNIFHRFYSEIEKQVSTEVRFKVLSTMIEIFTGAIHDSIRDQLEADIDE
jgi:uncharacterized tellurite resistance protein B-like protein